MENNTIKFVHTNLIARNWEKLAQFYIDVFACKPIYPKRNLEGEWLDDLTQIHQAKIQGIHLYLPGYEKGPTLEIFQYLPSSVEKQPLLNSPGFGHIAFHVDNIEAILEKIIEQGGELFGKVVKKHYPELNSHLTVTYVKDPEGNFIELQTWSKAQ